jgi:hypothetical protein
MTQGRGSDVGRLSELREQLSAEELERRKGPVVVSNLPEYDVVLEWHAKWVEVLEAHCRKMGVDPGPRPTPAFYVSLKERQSPAAGYYRSKEHGCYYPIEFVLVAGERFEGTVAHECVHAYQDKLYKGCRAHGEFFLYLLQEICGFRDRGVGHDYSLSAAKQKRDWLKLRGFVLP